MANICSFRDVETTLISPFSRDHPLFFSIIIFHRKQPHRLFNNVIRRNRVAVILCLEWIGVLHWWYLYTRPTASPRWILDGFLVIDWWSWLLGASNLLHKTVYIVWIDSCKLEWYLWLFVWYIDYLWVIAIVWMWVGLSHILIIAISNVNIKNYNIKTVSSYTEFNVDNHEYIYNFKIHYRSSTTWVWS